MRDKKKQDKILEEQLEGKKEIEGMKGGGIGGKLNEEKKKPKKDYKD
mgnify:CR=1 FL=1